MLSEQGREEKFDNDFLWGPKSMKWSGRSVPYMFLKTDFDLKISKSRKNIANFFPERRVDKPCQLLTKEN